MIVLAVLPAVGRGRMDMHTAAIILGLLPFGIMAGAIGLVHVLGKRRAARQAEIAIYWGRRP